MKAHTNCDIDNLGNTNTNFHWENIEKGCIHSMRGLYGGENKLLAELRHTKWVEKRKANTMSSVSDLENFPPMIEAARLNIKRAHYQCSIWRNSMPNTTCTLDVEQYGWISKTLQISV